MFRNLAFILTLGLYFAASAQEVSIKDIEFDKSDIDFGTIPAEGGNVDAVYTLVNKGSVDFKISDIEVACGCTHPEVSKKLVKPGDTAIIKAQFNPFGMVGTVEKWIRVNGNFNDALYKELRFQAEITSRVGSIENMQKKYYRGQYGYLVMYQQHMNFGNLVQDDMARDSIPLFNDGYHDIVISEITDLPPFLQVEQLPITIKPQETKSLYFTLNASGVDTIGPLYGEMKVKTNDRFYSTKSISYGVTIGLNFEDWGRWKKRRAAQFHVENKTINLGNMKSGEVREADIVVTNTGKNPLIIYRVDTDCSCAVLKNIQGTIAPGDSVTARVKFDSLYKKGKQTKAVTIYTNDPNQPVVVLGLRAIVD
ncbi:DUF1573 domain-containing protein [bacterium]|nr:DUF1573 domain-containing protein [bacterium]